MMKRYLLVFALFAALQSAAQTITSTKVDQNSIVRDDSGILLPYAIWQKIIQTGDYTLKRPNPSVAEYVLYKLSAEEKANAKEKQKAFTSAMPKPRASDAFREGEKFSGEKLTDINGNKYDTRKPDGKIYVINFWFINCGPCKREIPDLNELVAKYKENKDVVFIAIALDDRTDIKDFLKTMPFNYNIVDDGRYYASKYLVKSYPTHVIVGKDGLIKFSTLGLAPNTVQWIDKTIKAQIDGI